MSIKTSKRMKKRTFGVAIEGMPIIFIFAFLTLIFAITQFTLITIIFLLFTIFSCYFFRDPERIIPEEEGIVVSPADGKILKVENIVNPFTKQISIHISIFMSLFDVHVNRMPISAKIEKIIYYPGKFFNASLDKASKFNERCIYLLNSNSEKFTVIQIAGLIAQRIVCSIESGDNLNIGSRFGIIKFGSRVEIYIPTSYKTSVNKGDKVFAGQSIIAQKNTNS